MATCTVTLTANTTAVSGHVQYQALPNQAIAGVAIDTAIITATVATTVYSATLIQGASYRILSEYFPFSDRIFTVPAASSAILTDLLDDVRT